MPRDATSAPPDFYEILGVPSTASPRDIRSAHRALAIKVHPDTAEDGQGDPTRLAQIQNAYETLAVPDSRRRYDNMLAARRSEFAPPPRHPPKSPCSVCKQPVYASQLTLFLGRFMCRGCFARKRDRCRPTLHLSRVQQLRWKLQLAWVRVTSNWALALVAMLALGSIALGFARRQDFHLPWRTKNTIADTDSIEAPDCPPGAR